MKHILNNLSNEEKNSIREQHTGGMRVVTENFHKLLGSKLGDVKPLVSEQSTNVANNASIAGAIGGVVGGLVGAADAIANGTGTSDQKVKQFCNLCRKSKSQITQRSNQLADMVRDAVQGLGTDEKKIFNAFNSIKTFDELNIYSQKKPCLLFISLTLNEVFRFELFTLSLAFNTNSLSYSTPTPFILENKLQI
jgi:hypothetical protein